MSRTPAVVVGAEINGLGVIRSLGRAGVPVVSLSSDPKQPTARSRFASTLKCANERTDDIIESLVELGRRQEIRMPLFLTMEQTVEIVTRHRHELDRYFLINLPSHDTLSRLNNKLHLLQLAKDTGIAAPESRVLEHADDLRLLCDQLTFPIIIKPLKKNTAFDRHFGKRAVVLRSQAALQEQFRSYQWSDDKLLAQTFIDTPDSEIYFQLVYYSTEGRRLASFTGKKIRIWPPETGNTASATPVDEIPDITSAAHALLTAVEFQGIGSVEFKRCTAPNGFTLIEPTVGRTDYQSEIASANGVNIPYIAYCDLLGLPQPEHEAARHRERVVWVDMLGDQRAAEAARAAGTLDKERYRESISPPRVETIRAAQDMRPWLYTQRQRVVRRIKSALNSGFERFPSAYTVFVRVIPPDERWPPNDIMTALRRHELPSKSYVRYFTRDPKRTVPKRNRIIVSPADGVVRDIFEQQGRKIIDISMNFYDVHVQRAPISGTVVAVEQSGHFLERRSDEERRFFDDPWAYESDYLYPVQKVTTLETEIGTVRVRQISSVWARRIETFFTPGDMATIGDRLGSIFLGSTVIIELPATVNIRIAPQIKGRRRTRADRPIRGGETIIAEY